MAFSHAVKKVFFIVGTIAIIVQSGCILKNKNITTDIKSGRDGMPFEEICQYTLENLAQNDDFVPNKIIPADFALTKALITYIRTLQKLIFRVTDDNQLWSCAHSQIIEGFRQQRWPLILKNSKISDISILPVMENSKWVDLSLNQLTDASVNQISEVFPAARGVNLNGNHGITSCGPLKSLSDLYYADLAGTQITTIDSCFEHTHHLDRLPLSYLDIAVTSVSPESLNDFLAVYGKNLIGLRLFGLNRSNLTTINLDDLPKLRLLDISNTSIAHLVATKAHPLEYLDIRASAVKKLPESIKLKYLLTSQDSTILLNQKGLVGIAVAAAKGENPVVDMAVVAGLSQLEFGQLSKVMLNGMATDATFSGSKPGTWLVKGFDAPLEKSFLYVDTPQIESWSGFSPHIIRNFADAYEKILQSELNLQKEIK